MSDPEVQTTQPENEDPQAERPKAPPIGSRFLFVDVAALRAKQLRRGAKSRLSAESEESATKVLKPERIAMEEVHHGLVDWTLPEFTAVFDIR